MKKLLVAVDLSKISEKIVQKAIALAKDLSAEIVLVYIVSLDVGFIMGDVGFQYLPELEATELEEDDKCLKEIKERIEKQGVKCDVVIQQGIPEEKLIELSQKLGAYAIVIGSKGHGNLYNTLVGSVCHEIIKNSSVPVFVVPAEEP